MSGAPTAESVRDGYARYLMPTYAPSRTLVRGEGVRVWDVEGKEYLDFAAGVAVNTLGHAHPALRQALADQAGVLIHVSNLYAHPWQPKLAEAIVRHAGPGKCFFCNSGAEANEGLIKLARLWGHAEGRYEVISFTGSFHGRTLATLTATAQTKIQKGFDPLPEGFRYAEFNDLESARAAVTDKTVAVLVEAIQGEGGVRPADPAFLRGLRALCDERRLLLMFDEIQAGIGRTGEWFGWQHAGVRPDAFSMAKGLGGGVPIGGIWAAPAIADTFQPGNHATTFGGTPLACAAALAVIHTVEADDLVANARERGRQLREGLQSLAADVEAIECARGLGLLSGLVLGEPAAPLAAALADRGLLAIPTAGNVVRFVPPLTVTSNQIQQALDIVSAACAAVWPKSGRTA